MIRPMVANALFLVSGLHHIPLRADDVEDIVPGKAWAKPGQRFEMTVAFHKKRRHLPIVTLKRAA